MNYQHHIIHNFPENYPFWAKVWANLIFFVGGIIIHHRNNLLTKKDLKYAKKTLRKGDLVLVGCLSKASHIFINTPLTHAMIYIGNRTFVHSIGDGVETAGLHEVFCTYDSMMILKLNKRYKKAAGKMVKYAKNQIGKPYAFDFKLSQKKFFCSALIHYSLKAAGLNPKSFEKTHHKSLFRPHVLHPMDYIGGGFKIAFYSHNLDVKGKKVTLIEEGINNVTGELATEPILNT